MRPTKTNWTVNVRIHNPLCHWLLHADNLPISAKICGYIFRRPDASILIGRLKIRDACKKISFCHFLSIFHRFQYFEGANSLRMIKSIHSQLCDTHILLSNYECYREKNYHLLFVRGIYSSKSLSSHILWSII